MKGKLLSRVRLLATPWTAAYQAPPSMGFSRQEYSSGVPLPSLIYLIRVPQMEESQKLFEEIIFFNLIIGVIIIFVNFGDLINEKSISSVDKVFFYHSLNCFFFLVCFYCSSLDIQYNIESE